jgi:mono/diheme cytochrome c family protein
MMNMRNALTTLLLLPVAAFAADLDANGISDGWSFGQKDGAALYRSICAGCHMPEGQGATGGGSYPPLASNPRLASAQYPVITVLRGRKGMPPFRFMLSDEQVAAVTNYIRGNMGNRYTDAVTAADVKPLR